MGNKRKTLKANDKARAAHEKQQLSFLTSEPSAPINSTIDADGAPEASARVRAGGINSEDDASNEAVTSLAVVRAAFFVDGFNLYHGLNDANQNHLKWLDLWALAEALKLPEEQLVKVTWCSATPQNTDKAARHGTYVRALRSVGVEVILGHWAQEYISCRVLCDKARDEKNFSQTAEKEGDVNLALQAVTTADTYDKCYLVTGDSDQVPTLRYIRDKLRKKVGVFFPPNRPSKHLRDTVRTSRNITLEQIEQCRFPDIIQSEGFRDIRCPRAYLPEGEARPIQPQAKKSRKGAPAVERKQKRKVSSR